ncbi:MAG TPA: HEAT repeat domain-containing protein [Vicinamibacterales bacterium]|nr:HEAT repeat domain-containing protein [Vicinamibacterales bacterium]
MPGQRRSALPAIIALSAVVHLSPAAEQAPASGQPAVPPSLREVAQDVDSPDASVRRRALRVMREHGGPEPLALLGRLVNDEEVGIREEALEVVARLYVEPPARRRVGSVEDAFLIGPYYVTPWPAPPELARALVTVLADEYPSVRRDAAYALALVAPPPLSPRAAFELEASLSDRDPDVRVAAARALGRLRVGAAGVPLVGRVNDEALDVRLAAMRALGDIREKGAVRALTDQFEFYVRGVAGRSALDALARIADASSVPLFHAQTESHYPAHRQSAYEGLARTGTAKVTLDRIEAALASESDARVRLAMAFALGSTGRPIDPIVDAVLDERVAAQALEYLAELRPERAAELGKRLRDPDPVVRRYVAIALGFIGGPDAAAALAAAQTETNPDVRNAIQVAQLRIRSARS